MKYLYITNTCLHLYVNIYILLVIFLWGLLIDTGGVTAADQFAVIHTEPDSGPKNGSALTLIFTQRDLMFSAGPATGDTKNQA